MSKRILSLVLVVVMLVLAVPMTVFSAIAAGVSPTYADVRGNNAYVGWAGCGYWASNAPAHRPFSGAENNNGSWAGDSAAQLWNSQHWHRGVNYPGNWEFGVRPADDPNAWYPMDTNVCRVNYEITASAALTSSNNPNGASLPGYAATGQDLPMVYTHYGWELIKPSTDWNVSLRYTVDQAGTLNLLSDWMVNMGTASGYDGMAGSGAEGAIAIFINGEYCEMPWISASTGTALDRSGVTWKYDDVSTWVNIKDVARANATVFGNYRIDVKPGDTIELVVKKVGTTTGYVLGDYNLHLSYVGAPAAATGYASQMTPSVWADANEWGDWMRYQWSSGGNYIVINPGQSSQQSSGPYTTLADYAKYLKIPHTLYSNNWSVGTITSEYGYSAAQHFVAINGWTITDNGDGTYTETSNGWPQSGFHMMASAPYCAWVDRYLDVPAGGSSSAGDIWNTPGALTYWDKNNQTFNKNKITLNNNGAYAYSYLSDYAGVAQLQLAEFILNPEASGFKAHIAVAVNNEIVWPANATLNDKSNWLHVDGMSLAAINAELAKATAYVKAGDRISLCVGYSDITNWGAAATPNWTSSVDVKVQIENTQAPVASAGVAYKDSNPRIEYTVTVPYGANANSVGLTVDGVDYVGVKMNATTYKVAVYPTSNTAGTVAKATPFIKLADNAVTGIVGAAVDADFTVFYADPYEDIRTSGDYVGWAGCGYWASNAPAHRPFSGAENNNNGSWAGDSAAQLWNSQHWHRGVNYPGNWEFGVRPADDQSTWYPMDANVARQNYYITASAALTAAATGNAGYCAPDADFPMVYTHYGWELIKPSSGWNVSLRYTVDQAGTLCLNSDWMTNLGAASGYDGLAGSGAQGAVAIFVNGEYREVTWYGTDGQPLDRSGVTWDYTNGSTWTNIADIAKGNSAVMGNYYIDVKPGDTIELVVKKVGTTTGFVLGDYNLHLSYASTKPAHGYASQMTPTVWADANEWGDWMRYHWATGGNYVVINPGQNSQQSSGAYTTLADYAKYLKIPHTLYSNNWSVGTITSEYGYSAAQHFVAINGWTITDNGNGTYTETSKGFPQSGYYMMASAAYLDWVDRYLNVPAGGSSYAGEIWGTPAGLTYWDKNNATFNKNMITTNRDGAYAYSYLSDYAGIAKIQLKDFQINSAVSGFQTHIAIAVNNDIVWPAGATLNDKTNWLNVSTMSLADINRALEAATPAIKAGDRVSVCIGYSNVTNWASAAADKWTTSVDPMIYIESAANPTVQYSVGMSNGEYKLNVYITPSAGTNADIVGVSYNGQEYLGTKQADGTYKVSFSVTAKEIGDQMADITPFVKLTSGATNYAAGESKSTTIVEVLNAYVNSDNMDPAVKATATAMLNYSAAVQNFFGYNTDKLANAGLTEEQKQVTVTGTYTDKLAAKYPEAVKPATAVQYKSVTLITGDGIQIRVIVNGEYDGYVLRVNGLGDIALNSCGDGTSSAVFDVNVMNWNETYDMAVCDANGTQVSATMSYGVSTYYARMYGKGNAALDAVLDALMAVYEVNAG